VSLLPFLAASLGGGVLALLARRSERVAGSVALMALAASIGAAVLITPGETVAAGGATLATTGYARVVLILGAATGLGVVVVGMATSMARHLPAAILLGLGAAGVALSSADPVVAIMAACAGSFVPLVVTLAPPRSGGTTIVGAHQLRAVTIATALAVLAAAWTLRPLDVLAAEPAAAGLALFALAGAVAIRWGAIPFHRWAARVADTAQGVGLPVALVWGSAVLAIVVLAHADATVGEISGLAAERAVIVTVALATLLIGVAAAYLHDDLEHIVTYAIVADAGVVLFAFATLDPATWGPARLWLLAFVATRTAFAVWVAAVRGAFGVRRLRDLGGWARHSPLLAAALLVVAVATVGWPGLLAFDARSDIIRMAAGSALGPVALIGTLAHIGYFARILAVGLGRRSPQVAAGPASRLRAVRRGATRSGEALTALLEGNRAPIASAGTVALALIALLAVSGGLAGPGTAAGGPPRAPAIPTPSVSPSQSPRESAPPSAAPGSPAPSLEPSPSVSADPSPASADPDLPPASDGVDPPSAPTSPVVSPST